MMPPFRFNIWFWSPIRTFTIVIAQIECESERHKKCVPWKEQFIFVLVLGSPRVQGVRRNKEQCFTTKSNSWGKRKCGSVQSSFNTWDFFFFFWLECNRAIFPEARIMRRIFWNIFHSLSLSRCWSSFEPFEIINGTYILNNKTSENEPLQKHVGLHSFLEERITFNTATVFLSSPFS